MNKPADERINYLTELNCDNLPSNFYRLNESYIMHTTELHSHRIHFVVYEQVSFGSNLSGTELKKIESEEVEPTLDGQIGWDGCSHIDFIDEHKHDSYKHLCGCGSWINFTDMLTSLYSTAMQLIPNHDKSELMENA